VTISGRLESDVEVEQVGHIGTPEGLIEYLGVKGKPIEVQREVVQAFITGAGWAWPILENYVLDLRDMGLID
jgi:hypothetical protein